VALLYRFLDAEKEINFMRNIKLIEVPSEIGAGTRGASLGVEAIKVAAMDFMSNFFIHFPSERIPNENKLLYEPIESPYAKRIKGVYSMYEKVSKAVSETLKNNYVCCRQTVRQMQGEPQRHRHLCIRNPLRLERAK
jgi:arginase family enzyme